MYKLFSPDSLKLQQQHKPRLIWNEPVGEQVRLKACVTMVTGKPAFWNRKSRVSLK